MQYYFVLFDNTSEDRSRSKSWTPTQSPLSYIDPLKPKYEKGKSYDEMMFGEMTPERYEGADNKRPRRSLSELTSELHIK